LLLPSTWWEAVAQPHRKPRGKWNVADGMVYSLLGEKVWIIFENLENHPLLV
jgi:hypothetical protein